MARFYICNRLAYILFVKCINARSVSQVQEVGCYEQDGGYVQEINGIWPMLFQ